MDAPQIGPANIASSPITEPTAIPAVIPFSAAPVETLRITNIRMAVRIRSKQMIDVIADVRLQHSLFFFSSQSATMDEVPNHMTHFSGVGVFGNVIALRHHKSQTPLWIRLQRIL